MDYGYDKIGQLKSALGLESGGTTNRWNERFFYGYDATGNLSNRVQNVLTNVFNLDSLNQLTTVVRTNNSLTVAGTTTSIATNVTVADNGNSPVAATRYADATFARTNVTLLNGTNIFAAVAADSLGRWDTNTVTSYLPTAITFLYDQNGNLRTNGTRIFEYDDENQLTRITEPNAWKSEFTYDGKLKMRISRDYTWQGGAWVQTNEVRRVYDGMLVIQERDSLNLPRLTYTRGKDLSGSLGGAGGIGGLLAFSDHRSQILDHNYYHADGNGNVTCLTDTNQTIGVRYLYDPFGNTFTAIGTKAALNRYRFSTKEENVPSGMICYGYRWYVPELHRWLNGDPIHEPGFGLCARRNLYRESMGENLYRFVANNSINRTDPSGLCDISLGCNSVSGVATHCGVIAPDGTEFQMTTGDGSGREVPGSGPSGSSGSGLGLVHGQPDPNDTNYPVTCDRSCAEVQQCLQNYHDTADVPPYNPFGPNSNTYAHNMLDDCGCTVDPIPTTILRCPRAGGPISTTTTTPPGAVGW